MTNFYINIPMIKIKNNIVSNVLQKAANKVFYSPIRENNFYVEFQRVGTSCKNVIGCLQWTIQKFDHAFIYDRCLNK